LVAACGFAHSCCCTCQSVNIPYGNASTRGSMSASHAATAVAKPISYWDSQRAVHLCLRRAPQDQSLLAGLGRDQSGLAPSRPCHFPAVTVSRVQQCLPEHERMLSGLITSAAGNSAASCTAMRCLQNQLTSNDAKAASVLDMYCWIGESRQNMQCLASSPH
jgi:hypothetical protein